MLGQCTPLKDQELSTPSLVQPATFTGSQNVLEPQLVGTVESASKCISWSNTNVLSGVGIDELSNNHQRVGTDSQPNIEENNVSFLVQLTPNENQEPSHTLVTEASQQVLAHPVNPIGQPPDLLASSVDIGLPNVPESSTQMQNESVDIQQANNSNDIATFAAPIDNFIESISLPIVQPLLQSGTSSLMPHTVSSTSNNFRHISPPPSSAQRKSTRLAQKAVTNSGKGYIQIAQDLLIRKLVICQGKIKTRIQTRILLLILTFMHSTWTGQ